MPSWTSCPQPTPKQHPVLLFIDIDELQVINVLTRPTSVGDAFLVEVADELAALRRPPATLSRRLGGDEFSSS